MTAPELPHSLEAEEYLISSALLDSADAMPRILEAGIVSESFYDPKHGIVFQAMTGLHGRGIALDVGVLAEELKATKDLERIGDYSFLIQVSGRVSTTAQLGFFVEKVRELAGHRSEIIEANALVEALQTGDAARAARARDALASGAASAKGARVLPIWSPSEFLKHDVDPGACLLGTGYVARGAWTSFIGAGGLGKSRLALTLAVAQITGTEWCGLNTGGHPQRWLFLGTENSIARWKTDLTATLARLDPTHREAVEQNLRALALTGEAAAGLDIATHEGRATLTATIREESPGVIVFDPLAELIEGDENTAKDMRATLQTLRRIIAAANCGQAAVLVVHHARTGAANVAQAGDNFAAGNFARGSKALFSSVRCELQLAPADRDDPNKLVLSCGKSNDAERFQTRGIVFDPESWTYDVNPDFDLDGWRADVAGKVREPSVSLAEVVESVARLAPHPGDEISTKSVAEDLTDSGAKLRTIQRRLNDGVRAGYLRNGKKRSTWRLGSKPLPK